MPSASKTGFLTVRYGEKPPGVFRAGTPIAVAEGQRIPVTIADGGTTTQDVRNR